ncbi:MAG: 2,3-bisphosphoglycerate-independent phosphoglycerate mutase [Candidatus Heimdallarchaeota archaeon]|nr:2,3-bisphosphoglycerate-independent phosphoglycerate mutase [Candidatus Heimdallarchaeota archaeon]
MAIIDGFGIAPKSDSNAISMANMKNWNKLQNEFPHTDLDASGNSVGLPDGIMGNSEVGHLTIGTGRIQYQSLELINRSCKENSLSSNKIILDIIESLNQSNSRLHLMGLLSDGGVHSHTDHLYYLLHLFRSTIKNKIFIHGITDGRDTPPTSSAKYISELLDNIKDFKSTTLATIAGRYYAMDRDKKWDRTKLAYDLYVNGIGEETNDVLGLVKSRSYEGETDEFLKPIMIDSDGIIKENDIVLIFNFRPDRARQITMAFSGLADFESSVKNKLNIITMTRYKNSWKFPVLFNNPVLTNSLAEIIANQSFKQVHIAETEKYAHVTYFLNGGTEIDFPLEKRIMIPSSKVATYDLEPEMSTLEIAKVTIKEIASRENKLIVVNIAAPDMVGHTGKIPPTIKALEITDEALGMIYESCRKNEYTLIITSDHGNCEQMIFQGAPHTAHTTNKVPFLITHNLKLKSGMGLSSIAPTILEFLNIQIPTEIDSPSLLDN